LGDSFSLDALSDPPCKRKSVAVATAEMLMPPPSTRSLPVALPPRKRSRARPFRRNERGRLVAEALAPRAHGLKAIAIVRQMRGFRAKEDCRPLG
jgi:hypothetical protein